MKETGEQMKRLMEKIQMPEEGIAQLLEARKELEEADHWDVIVQTAEQVMEADGELSVLTQALAETEAREEALGVNRYLLDALMLWCCWEEVKVRYEKQGLPVEIYYKSLEDMKWKMLECYEIHGVYGNFVGHWYDGFFNLTRFGLGRLQFELRPFEGKKDCGLDGVRSCCAIEEDAKRIKHLIDILLSIIREIVIKGLSFEVNHILLISLQTFLKISVIATCSRRDRSFSRFGIVAVEDNLTPIF